MEAKQSNGRDLNRQILGNIIPLQTPFTVFINPSTLCNFKCFYCTHGKSDNELKQMSFIRKNMEMDIFEEAILQLKEFDDKLKLIYLYGNGEPLCNPHFAEMIEAVTRANITEKLETFTNASLLTHDKSKDIIDAGLTKLKISIQGVNAKQYEKIIGKVFDFDTMVEQIEYFYRNRKNCKVFIKIIDTDLTEDEKNSFYKIFGNICDEIDVESLTFTQRTMDNYDGIIIKKTNLWNQPLVEQEVCPFPFYTIRIGVDGDMQPCFETVFSKEQINIHRMSVKQYWNSTYLKTFYITQLKKEKGKISLCNQCLGGSVCVLPEEHLDQYAEKILMRMGETI